MSRCNVVSCGEKATRDDNHPVRRSPPTVFTLVKLSAVIASIGELVALPQPAVQSVGESGRRAGRMQRIAAP
jgi:hypothetical protein